MLLIVFMVTAPLLTTDLEIELPEVEAAQATVKESRLLVNVTAEGKILFGKKDITGRVADAFRESRRIQIERELYIRADKAARYGAVAEVVAAARNSGVSSLNLLVQPDVEPDDNNAKAAPSSIPVKPASQKTTK